MGTHALMALAVAAVVAPVSGLLDCGPEDNYVGCAFEDCSKDILTGQDLAFAEAVEENAANAPAAARAVRRSRARENAKIRARSVAAGAV